jgi:uncharacterized protein
MAASFKVLALDGGGIRGIIPALLLAALEDQTRRPICESFDLIAGTSTGGIIALGLTKPDANGHVEKSATDIARLYEDEDDTIFPPSIMHSLHVRCSNSCKSMALCAATSASNST